MTRSAPAWSAAPSSRFAGVAVGFAGALLIALAGDARVDGRPVDWWFHVHAGSGPWLVFSGLGLLCAGWLWLGSAGASPRWLMVAAGLWGLPLALGPALFSGDLYSYLAQGTMVNLGVDPYRHGPAVLAGLGHPTVLGAVSPFWRDTVAPYGPLFLWLASLAASIAGTHLVVGALLLRVPELAGIALMAVFVPRLARACSADPVRALWLVVPAPLTLVELVGAGHNDALMAGLLVAGVTLAVERRWAAGVALCALAALVKLPAVAAVGFVAVVWLRDDPARGGRIVAACASICVVVAAAVSLVSGLGTSWLSSGFLSSPGKLHLAVTPATELGWVLAHLLGVAARPLEDAAVAVTLGVAALLGVWLLWRVRRATLVPFLGLFLVLLAAAGPALWPWYLLWGLALLAAWAPAQRSWLMVAALTVPVLMIYPNGQLIVSRSAAPWILLVYLGLGACLLRGRALPGSLRQSRRAPAAAPLPRP